MGSAASASSTRSLKHRNSGSPAKLLLITKAITLSPTDLMESLTSSHGLQMGEAFIAATANVKHFDAIASLTVEAFVP